MTRGYNWDMVNITIIEVPCKGCGNKQKVLVARMGDEVRCELCGELLYKDGKYVKKRGIN